MMLEAVLNWSGPVVIEKSKLMARIQLGWACAADPLRILAIFCELIPQALRRTTFWSDKA
jgi:hypothetical protein